MTDEEKSFENYLNAYLYFTAKTGNPETGARLARDFFTAISAGTAIANKNILDTQTLKWILKIGDVDGEQNIL